MVTNMLDSLRSEAISLMVCMIVAGWASWEAAVRNSDFVTAITRAEGMPLPLTSPMQKKSFSSRMKKV